MVDTKADVEPKIEPQCPSSASVDPPESYHPSTKLTSLSTAARRIWWPFLLLPYMIGILWHGVHPIVSVLTGQAHARGWYIDESSLDPSNFRMDTQKHYTSFRPTKASVSNKGEPSGIPVVCDQLALLPGSTRNIDCYRHADEFTVTRIVPASNAVAPVSEALVLVVPFCKDWKANAFHFAFLQLIQRLSTAPWLAKTVFFVSPAANNTATGTSLADCVDLFLEMYLGSASHHPTRATSAENTPLVSLPDAWSGAMIRQLLVFDALTESKQQGVTELHQLEILTAGRRGLLPNMDLVVLIQRVYTRARFLQTNKRWKAQTVLHPYSTAADEWLLWMERTTGTTVATLPARVQAWANGLLQLLCFEYTLAVGPPAPHASALDRGIDSLTVRFRFYGESPATQAAYLSESVQKVEAVVRGLSNLHERLHHSTSLYLFSVTSKFVKHEEYLVPNLLLLVPLVIRVVTLVLFDIPRLDLVAMLSAVSTMLMGTMAIAFLLPLVEGIYASFPRVASDSLILFHSVIAAVYTAILWWKSQSLPTRKSLLNNTGTLQSVQLMACLVALYIHVPIAFGHVSLAFPSALFWTPLIAFPSFRQPSTSTSSAPMRGLVSMLVFLATFPSVFLVPRVFATYTPYVKYAYVPLHLLLTLLYLPISSSSLAVPRQQA